MRDESELVNSLREVTAVAVSEIDYAGRLLDANEGFLRLLPAGAEPPRGRAVGMYFLSPVYQQLIELSVSQTDTVYRGLLTLGEPAGKARSLRGTVSRTGLGLFFLLEHDIEELELVCEKSLEAGAELAQAHRELISIHHRLELAEAERKQSQEQLRRSEEKLLRVLNNLPVQASLLDREGVILWVNRAVLHFLGEKLEDVVGRRIWDRPPGFQLQPEPKVELRVMCERAARGIPCRTDLAMEVPGTGAKVLDLHLVPIPSDAGDVEFLVASAVDVTERKRAVEALAEESIRRRVFIEESSDGIVTLHDDGRVYEGNRRFAEMLGYSWEELHQLHVWDWDVQWTRQELMSMVGQSGDEGMRLETRHRRKDGKIIDVEITANGVIQGGRKMVFCVCRDVSERKRAEQEIRASRERFQRALENIPDVVVIYDREFRVQYLNTATTQITGRPAADFLGKRDDEVLPPEVYRVYLPTLQEALKMRTTRSLEADLTFPGTGTRRLHITCVPLFDDKGEVREVMGITHDLTPRKNFEREIERLNRMYATLSELNQLIVRGKSREELLDEVCRITVAHAGYAVVWVGWIDHRTQRVNPIAQAGERAGDFTRIDVYADDRPEGQGLVGNCIRSGKPCVITDFVNDPRSLPWREAVVALELRSGAAIPIRFQGEVVGTFTVYAAEEDVFRDKEVALLQEAATTISFALEHLDQEQRRRDAEQALRQREAQYRAVIETTPDGFYVLDRTGRFLEVNDAYVRLSGYSRAALLGMTISDLDARKTPEEIVAHIERIRVDGSDLFESFHRAQDGTVWPVEVNVSYWPEAGGLLFEFVRDISERKQVERELRQWADAFENCAHGIELGDPATNTILACNPAFSRMLGCGSGDLLGSGVFELYDPLDHDLVRDGIQQARELGQARFEARMRRSDGSSLLVQMDLVYVRNSEGNPLYRVATAQDITERKRAENEIRELNASLEQRVAERTTQLVAANAGLARAARLKDEFLASMSHELRTPLSGILSMSEALQEGVYGTLSKAQKAAVRDTEECGRHLLTLINDILDVAKIEAGKLELQCDTVAVEQLCQASHRLIKETAQKKGITVALAVDPHVRRMAADSRRLKQILVNLLSNAVKFTPEGGRVGLDVAGDRQNRLVRFSVWDTGIGIGPEDLERLFQPFVQLDSSLARQYEGTGLGLVLVKRLAELHDGAVQVDSQLGSGSRFTVIIPWIEQQTDDTGTAIAEAE